MSRRKGVQGVLVDLSGTLHVEDQATSRAVEALKKLRASEVKVKFVTNTTKESRRVLFERLRKLGFEIELSEIFTSLNSAVELIKREKLKPLLVIDDAALEDFSDVSTFEGKPDAVVVGLAPDKFNRTYLNHALRLLLDGARLIAIHAGRYYKTSTGLSLGPGPFVKLLEFAAGVEATVVGKPNAEFFQAALNSLEISDPSAVVMIGDDVMDDVHGAQQLGLAGYLVRTGKYRCGDESKIEPKPFRIVDDFASAVDEICALKNQ